MFEAANVKKNAKVCYIQALFNFAQLMEIKKLSLYSKDVNEQLHFYHSILGLELLKATEDEVSLNAGSTQLCFRYSESAQFYHYCFLIPTGKLEEAVVYLKSRAIKLLPYEGEEIVQFSTGRSIYFYDPDGNIAEFIERPSLGIKSIEVFSTKSILKVNEIGLPHNNPLTKSRKLINKYGINLSQPEIMREDFCWVGDYNGVLIIPIIGRNWIPTDLPAEMNDFEIEFSTSKGHFRIIVKNNTFEEKLF